VTKPRTKIATEVPPVGAPHAAPDFDIATVKDGRSMRRPYKISADVQDWQAFQIMAQQEGWRVPQNELSLHRLGGCSQAWALRDESATIGLVTGVRHQHSAWIGNLIITPTMRGRGHGAALFDHAAGELRAAGVTTLWLTASAAGAPLYAARGFHSVGQIERWVRQEGRHGEGFLAEERVHGAHTDAAIWGDDRSNLLHHLESAGTWLRHGESLALLHRGDDLQIIGPWYSAGERQDDAVLLDRLVALAAAQQELVIDLVADSGRQSLLAAAGFTPGGRTELMVSGPIQVQWSRLLALATLGSCG
jgi:GNAT superfamily N-acetyltransferase